MKAEQLEQERGQVIEHRKFLDMQQQQQRDRERERGRGRSLSDEF
jgi:hypothetical protein